MEAPKPGPSDFSPAHSPSDWAYTVSTSQKLGFFQMPQNRLDLPDVRRWLEDAAHQSMAFLGAVERFSNKWPTVTNYSDPSDDLLPIDVIWGRYLPNIRSIEIYVERIAHDAQKHDWEVNDLLTIVRTHEQAHALVHLAFHPNETEQALRQFGQDGATDWDNVLLGRENTLSALGAEAHELLAQALTWASISKAPINDEQRDRLLTTFSDVEKHQPAHYRLSPEIKAACSCAQWPLVLRAARHEVEVTAKNSFPIVDGLRHLIQLIEA